MRGEISLDAKATFQAESLVAAEPLDAQRPAVRRRRIDSSATT